MDINANTANTTGKSESRQAMDRIKYILKQTFDICTLVETTILDIKKTCIQNEYCGVRAEIWVCVFHYNSR